MAGINLTKKLKVYITPVVFQKAVIVKYLHKVKARKQLYVRKHASF